MTPELSVIIVNFNGGEDIKRCVESVILNGKGIDLRISVVDNSSTDGSCRWLEVNFPEINVVSNLENVGFARANNQILKQTETDYVALVNPDVILPDRALRQLTDFLSTHPDAGIVGPKQIDEQGNFNPASKMGRATILNTLSKWSRLDTVFPNSELLSSYCLRYLDNDSISIVDAVSGACCVARTSVLREVGYFDERFPLGCEDLDLCYRIAVLANIYYYPEVTIVHGGRKSRKKYPELSIRGFTQGAKLLYQKYEGSTNPAWLNALVWTGLDLSAVARIGFTRLLSQTKRRG